MKLVYRSLALETYAEARDSLLHGNNYAALILFRACAVNSLCYVVEDELSIKISSDTKLKKLISMADGVIKEDILDGLRYLDSINPESDTYRVNVELGKIKNSLKHLIGECLNENL